MPFTLANYQPNLPSWSGIKPPTHNHTSQNTAFNPLMNRPAFYESTINYLFGNDPSRRVINDPSGRTEVQWQCSECRTYGPFQAFAIDHKTGWRNYLQLVGPQTQADAFMAYNDVSNLRILCSMCNSSGDSNLINT